MSLLLGCLLKLSIMLRHYSINDIKEILIKILIMAGEKELFTFIKSILLNILHNASHILLYYYNFKHKI